jgi:hypothetical protein
MHEFFTFGEVVLACGDTAVMQLPVQLWYIPCTSGTTHASRACCLAAALCAQIADNAAKLTEPNSTYTCQLPCQSNQKAIAGGCCDGAHATRSGFVYAQATLESLLGMSRLHVGPGG